MLFTDREFRPVWGPGKCWSGRGHAEFLSTTLLLVAYVTPTIIRFFVSTTTMAKAIGTTLVVSLFAAGLIERDSLTSVWCFFAAILSGVILVAVRREPGTHETFARQSRP